MSILTLIVPAIAVLLIAAPLVSVAQGKVTGKSAVRNRFALHFGAFALACICAVAVPASGVAFAETAETVVSIMGTNAQGMGFLAAALVTGLAAIGRRCGRSLCRPRRHRRCFRGPQGLR